jgi:hypothetical protein
MTVNNYLLFLYFTQSGIMQYGFENYVRNKQYCNYSLACEASFLF